MELSRLDRLKVHWMFAVHHANRLATTLLHGWAVLVIIVLYMWGSLLLVCGIVWLFEFARDRVAPDVDGPTPAVVYVITGRGA